MKIAKRVLSLLLTLLIIASAVPLTVGAAEDVELPGVNIEGDTVETPSVSEYLAEGTCGDNLTWKISYDGVLTISGTGKMATGSPWSQYAENVNTVIIESGITTIAAGAFWEMENITYVDMPYGLLSIGSNAFAFCYNLSSVNFPPSVTTIGREAFAYCTSLTYVEIPVNVNSLGSAAFSHCTGLNSLMVIEGNSTYHSQGNCIIRTADKTLVAGCMTSQIPADGSVTVIGEDAFIGCEGLTKLEIPEGITSIDKYAFEYCTGLTEVVISEGVTSIGNYAFFACVNLKTITIPASVTEIGEKSFYNGGEFMSQVTICGSANSYAQSYAQAHNATFNEVSVHEHTFELSAGQGAECDSDGFMVYRCTGCGEEYTEVIPAPGHKYEETVVDPDCTRSGYTLYSCTACGLTYTDNLVEALGHSYTSVVVPSTCTAQGYTRYTCSVCDYTYDSDYTDATGHSFVDTVVAPTCTAQGYTVYTCSVCDYTHIDDFIEATGHKYTDWHTIKDSTCTVQGEKQRVCELCSNVDVESIPLKDHTYTEKFIDPTCTDRGYTEYTCSVCGCKYAADYTDATGHTLGDWITSKPATVLEEGSRHRDCEDCDYSELEILPVLVVDIETDTNYGRADFTVVNAQSKEPVAGAQLYIVTEHDGEATISTDENGTVSIVLPVGKHSVSAYAAGCLVRNLKVTVKSGINAIPQIGLSDQPTYNAEITSTPMTYEEIVDAGIDTTAPENQHIYKYELKLDFEAEIDVDSILFYFNENGDVVVPKPKPPEFPTIPDPDPVPGDPSYVLSYMILEDGDEEFTCYHSEIVEGPGEVVPLKYKPFDMNADYDFDGWYEDPQFTKPITEKVIGEYHRNMVYGKWNYVGEPDPGVSVDDDNNIKVYPVSEYFYLIVRGEVKWLKEMFDVEMLVINNSNTDTLENLEATLNLPDGLSLPAMVDGQQSVSQYLGKISEGGSASAHWYVRGDTAGSYDLEARLTGSVMPFEEPIDDLFVGADKLQVYAGNAMHLNFEMPETAYYDDDYPIKITLTNTSDRTIYNISHMVQVSEGMECYYSDGTDKCRIETSAWNSMGLKEFNPGDSIIIETTVNIFFESKMMEHELQKYVDRVDNMEKAWLAYKHISFAIDVAGGLKTLMTDGAGAIKEALDLTSDISLEKIETVTDIASFMSDITNVDVLGGNNLFDAMIGLMSIDVVEEIEMLIEDPVEWIKSTSLADMISFLTPLKSIAIAVTENPSPKFNLFDSLRTAISAIPIKYVMANAIMNTDPANTTTIPWSYTTTDVGPRYFGVSNVSKYMNALITVFCNEVYGELMPSYLQLIPGLDDPFSAEEAIKYIQATEKEIALIKAKDATGEITFKAWVERNGTAAEDIELSVDNESATIENGKLTFTGDSMISVKPTGSQDGTLHIEDSEGNAYTYEIDVVEPHTCVASKRDVVMVATAKNEGFATLSCDVCGEIMDIETLTYDNVCTEHTYGEWIIAADATLEADGAKTRECSVCGYTEYELIEKLVPEVVLESIEINALPEKIEYLIGEELDTFGLEITLNYSDGTSEVVSDGFAVSGFDSETKGVKTIVVVYEGKIATFEVTVVEPVILSGIEITSLPEKIEYLIGEELDTFGLEITLNYSDGTSAAVTEGFAVSGFDSETKGLKTIVVVYEGKVATFEVTVVSPYLAEGICGEGLTWTLTHEGLLTIAGNGAMDYGVSSPWGDYMDFVTAIVIEEGVTTVGHWAFEDLNNSVSIVLPDTIEVIDSYAFSFCYGLTDIVIPEGVTTIGKEAFAYCTGLTSIILPASLSELGEIAFFNCEALTGITVTEGNETYYSEGNCVIRIADSTLVVGCTSSVIPEGVTAIGDYAFMDCKGISEIFIPAAVESIGKNAFYGIENLIICGYAGTVAEAYANENKITFKAVEVNVVMGDVNNDNVLNAVDVFYYIKLLTGYVEVTDHIRQVADVNGDGKFNGSDLYYIKRMVLGYEV